jgi:hypothetical protein
MKNIIATSLLVIGSSLAGITGAYAADTTGSYSVAQTQFEEGQAAQASQGTVTRAQVKADLAQVEKAGYNPSDWMHYPQNLQAAEAKIHPEAQAGLTRAEVYQDLVQAKKDGSIVQYPGR